MYSMFFIVSSKEFVLFWTMGRFPVMMLYFGVASVYESVG